MTIKQDSLNNPTMPKCSHCQKPIAPFRVEKHGPYCEGCELMKTAEVLEAIPLGRGAIMRLGERGVLQRVRIGSRTIRWFRLSVDAWLDQNAPARRPERKGV
jgi:predicted DNA-binding transcriptional regulator AlpA